MQLRVISRAMPLKEPETRARGDKKETVESFDNEESERKKRRQKKAERRDDDNDAVTSMSMKRC